MERKAFLKLAASSLIVATTMVGCSGASMRTGAAISQDKAETQAAMNAHAAEKALASKDAARAVASGEIAVGLDADNASYRALLGRAYLLAGRYTSARTAFDDAMSLGNRDPRTIVSLALIRVAQGQVGQARDLLFTNIDVLPAADYGLGMAMAGDTNEAIRVLSQAIHDPAAGPKERQNLAYSYALAGRWVDARMMASQDLPPLEAAQRVVRWASMAQTGAESQRVIAMMGVNPVADDGGMPVRLALNTASSQPVEMAAAPVAPEIEAAPPMQAQAAETMTPAPSVRFARSVPVIQAIATPAREAVAPRARRAAAPVKVAISAPDRPLVQKVALVGPVAAAQGSKWVVQLGAFDSPAVAKASWTRMTQSNASLRSFPIITTAATVNGRTFHRLAVAGFGNRAGAVSLCGSIQAQGGNCFVRQGGAEAAPQKWAAAKPAKVQKVAMR